MWSCSDARGVGPPRTVEPVVEAQKPQPKCRKGTPGADAVRNGPDIRGWRRSLKPPGAEMLVLVMDSPPLATNVTSREYLPCCVRLSNS